MGHLLPIKTIVLGPSKFIPYGKNFISQFQHYNNFLEKKCPSTSLGTEGIWVAMTIFSEIYVVNKTRVVNDRLSPSFDKR